MGHVLVKLGQRKFMKELYEDGRLLMKQLLYYTDVENEAQGDRNEGLRARYTDENPTFKATATIGGRSFPLDAQEIRIMSPVRRHGVHCMYGIDTPENYDRTLSHEVLRRIVEDKDIAKFKYDTLVLIKDSPEFARRMHQAANRAGYELYHDKIEYVPTSHCGDMGPFRKLDAYKYQSESRFLTSTPIPGDTFLTLGPLWDVVYGWIEMNPAR